MDNPGGSKTKDTNKVAPCSSDSDDNDRASGSVTFFRKLKKRVKKRTYRRQTSASGAEESNPSSSNGNHSANPGGGASAARVQRRLKKSKKLRRSNVRDDENDNSNPDSAANDAEDGILNCTGEAEEGSDEWTTVSEDEPVFLPVLRKFTPKWTFLTAQETMRRQIGQAVNFERRFYGSVHTVECLQVMGRLEGHEGCVNTVEFNENGQLLASGSDDLAVCVWDWATRKKRNSYDSGHRNNVFQASWLPYDDSNMVTCASDGQVRLLDLVRGTTRKLASHHGACNKFATHNDTPHVAMSVGDDGKILSIDVREAEPTKLVTMKKRAFTVQLYTIHSNPRKSHEFCVGGHSRSIKIFDRRRAGKPICKLCPIKLSHNVRVHVTAVTYNHDGSEILASYNDDDIYLFDVLIPHPNGDYAHKYKGHRNSRTVKGVNYFGPNSEFIVSGSDCGYIFFWEKNTECIVQCARGDMHGVVNCVKPHPTIPVLASSGLDNDVKMWMPSTHKPPSMTQLKSCVTTNLKNRSDSQSRRGDSLFCYILEHLWQNNELFSHESDTHSDGTTTNDETEAERDVDEDVDDDGDWHVDADD